jgi:hypothetical protein
MAALTAAIVFFLKFSNNLSHDKTNPFSPLDVCTVDYAIAST